MSHRNFPWDEIHWDEILEQEAREQMEEMGCDEMFIECALEAWREGDTVTVVSSAPATKKRTGKRNLLMAKVKYAPSEKLKTQIENNFVYHGPIGDQMQRYVAIRDAYRDLATCLAQWCPESRELSVALT